MPASIHKIALIPGDGAGQIVLKEMRKILEIINSHQKTQVQIEEFPFNGKYFLRHQQAVSSDFLMRLKKDYKGLIIGALGDPTIQNQSYIKMMRHNVEKTMELKAVIQSFTLVHPKKTPLRGLNSGDINILLFRDKASFFGEKQGLSLFEGEKEETVIESQVQTVHKAAKDLELILGFIQKRYQGNVTLVLAKQTFPYSSKIWEKLFLEKLSAYPSLKGLVLDYNLFLRKFLANPHGRNVIISPGYCGEFMTALFSELTNGPLSSVQCQFNEKERFFAEPLHRSIGSLKDHSRVSPFGALLTLALSYFMLDMRGTGRLVRDAVLKAYENNWLTPDMDGSMTTEAVGDFISAWIDKKLTEEQKLFTV